ncbi:hypothetical protein N7532_008549 [Penicillium argentinense]|uniref:Uncharacterized protein n=1 Tax=Penicillium argentinense TaxID=1131581 RepID=A0A9W9K202_9EURO|nr:uncharacterized protein N7532_008549 [Penicillium argentinense]KAJ5089865.1 hypothetical protein N7532_008549 [Penicillium argentinense]
MCREREEERKAEEEEEGRVDTGVVRQGRSLHAGLLDLPWLPPGECEYSVYWVYGSPVTTLEET